MNDAAMTALIVFAIFSLPGWIMLIYALKSRRARERREERERARTTGSIVEYVRETKRYWRGPTVRFTRPVVEYRAEGSVYNRQYENSLSPEQYPVGANVDVVYDADDPSRFHLDVDEEFSQGARGYVKGAVIWLLICVVLAAALTLVVEHRPLTRRRSRQTAPRVTASVKLPSRDSDYQYEVRGNLTAIIKGYSGDDEALILPLTLGGHPVTAISSQAFARAMQLKRVTVPGTIAQIPIAAFAGCLSLQEVTLEEGVTDIGRHAFVFCMLLRDVHLPKSVRRIDDAFPEACNACFHVAEGSYAQRYCEENGYVVVVEE